MDAVYLGWLVIAMQLADVVLTYLGIRAGGREVNPVMLKLQAWLPGKWTWLWVAKAAAIGAVAWTLGVDSEDASLGYIVLILFYTWVLANNYKVWRGLKR